MAHSIEQIADLLSAYDLLALQSSWLQWALDHAGTSVPVTSPQDLPITYIPVFSHPWLDDKLSALMADIAARRADIKTDLES